MATTKIEASNIATGAVPSTGFTSVQIFTAAATWTRPTDITKVIVEVQGGGAGGARDATGTQQIGGSAGGYAMKVIDVSSVTNSVLSIGGAGAGATSTDTAGADGGDSRWLDTGHGGSSDVKGIKGVGGNTAWTRTVGGLGSGGDLNIQGGDGGANILGNGGSSQFGHGGQNWSVVDLQNIATGYGAGGGAMETSGGNGGAGTAGIVVVWEYK